MGRIEKWTKDKRDSRRQEMAIDVAFKVLKIVAIRETRKRNIFESFFLCLENCNVLNILIRHQFKYKHEIYFFLLTTHFSIVKQAFSGQKYVVSKRDFFFPFCLIFPFSFGFYIILLTRMEFIITFIIQIMRAINFQISA